MNIKNTLKKHIFISFTIRALGAIAALLMSVAVTRLLPSDEAGYYFLAFTLITIIVPINFFGTDTTSLRFIGSADKENFWEDVQGFAYTALGTTLSLSFITSLLIWFIAPFLANNFWGKPEMLPILQKSAIVTILLSISTIMAYLLQALHKTAISTTLITIVIPISVTILVFLLGLKTADELLTLLIFISVVNSIFSILYWLKVTTACRPKLPDVRYLYSTSFPIWIGVIVGMMTIWGSQLLAAAWVNPTEIAYLSTAQRTANLVSFILVASNLIVAPHFASLYKNGDIVSLKNLTLKLSKFLTITSVILVVIIFMFSSSIMSIFGEQFKAGANLLIILAVGQMIAVMTGPVGYLLAMSGHEKDMRNIVLLFGSITIILALILIPFYGVLGAAIATTIGISLQNIGGVWMVRKRLGINTLWILNIWLVKYHQ